MAESGAGRRADERFPRRSRIRRRPDFLAIQNGGRRIAGPRFFMFTRPGSGRIGITVSRKVGGAVLRNRVKRWIRECYRRGRIGWFPLVDVVVVARPGAATTSQNAVCEELAALGARVGAKR